MRQNLSDGVRCWARAAAVVVLAGAGTAVAHDEDWRKLADREPAFVGPIWTLGMPVNRNDPQFDANQVTCLSWIPLNNFAGAHASGNDCWGYVSPSGREYAIMGLQAGFGFVEITNPVQPVIVETIAAPNSPWHDVKVIGDYAYGVSEGGSGIQIMDLSDIDNGNVTLVQNWTSGGFSTAHNIVANTDSGYLYLTGANISNGGLVAIDISNPVAPSIAGAWSDFYVHDAQVVSYTSGPFAGREIAFCGSGTGNGSGSTGLRIVDVTDKNNMFTMSTTFYVGAQYAHQVWISPDKQTLYLNDELDEGVTVGVTTTRVFDISDLTSPAFVGTFTSGSTAIDHNLYTRDQYIFEANYRSGLRVFDATDPNNPVQIAYFDTYPGSDAVAYNGAWSCYPYFPSGIVIVSDIERGLFVLRIDAIPSDYLDVAITQGVPNQILPGAPVEVIATITESGLVVDPSAVTLHYTVNNGAEQTSPMSDIGGGQFSGSILGLLCFDETTTFVRALAMTGETFSSQQSSGSVFSGETVILNDDAETDIGWTVSGSATDGQWDRGVPVNAGRGDPSNDFDGSGQAWLTDNDAANGGNSDVDNGETILTSPLFDLSDNDKVTWAYWFNDVPNGGLNGDSFIVEFSVDGGGWQPLRSVSTASGLWRTDEVTIGDEIPASTQTRFRFTAQDIGNQNVVEAGLDAFRIATIECTEPNAACSEADLTTQGAGAGDPGFGVPDGVITAADINFYVNLWVVADPAADVTTQGAGALDPGFGVPDGLVTAADINYYVNLWVLGCP